MALDLKKMQALLDGMQKKSGTTGDNNFFKPKDGDNVVRIVPLASTPDDPFVKLLFHYLNNKTILSPRTYGGVDPIADFSDALIAQGNGKLSKDEYKAAKKFSPQLRTYALVIDRENEDVGPRFWGFGKTVAEDIIKLMLDPDYGDITDPKNGFDLKVSFTPAEKSDTKFAKTEVRPSRKESPLSKDKEKAEKWLSEQPDIHTIFKRWTEEELTNFLHNYLNPTVQAGPPAIAEEAAKAAAETSLDIPSPISASAAPDVDDEFARVFNS